MPNLLQNKVTFWRNAVHPSALNCCILFFATVTSEIALRISWSLLCKHSDNSFVYPRIVNIKCALKTKSNDSNTPTLVCIFGQSPLCELSSPRLMSTSYPPLGKSRYNYLEHSLKHTYPPLHCLMQAISKVQENSLCC